MPFFDVTYEAIGYTTNPSIIDNELSGEDARGFTDQLRAEGGLPAGIEDVLRGYITVDDEQEGTREKKLFVSVTIRVTAANAEAAEANETPARLLTPIADMMGTCDNEVVLDLEANSWEVMDVEEHVIAQVA